MEDKAIVIRKPTHHVGDGGTFIADQPPNFGQAPKSFVDAMDDFATALNNLFDVISPVVEKFVNDVAPIIAELAAYDPQAEERARSKADVAAKRREMRRRKGRV